jgi:hypothetical protein
VGTVFKALLDRRHLANPRAFEHAYDREARTAAPAMVGKAPPRSTFYRWLSGDVRSLPHPLHLPVLASMFPIGSSANCSRNTDRGCPSTGPRLHGPRVPT